MSNLLSCAQWRKDDQSIGSASSKLFLNEFCSDVTLVVGPERRRVPGHKLLLSICSWEFYNVFELVKLDKDELPIDGVSYEASLCFLEFCYKGKVDLKEENVWDVLKLADRFNVEQLTKVCKEYLTSNFLYYDSFEDFPYEMMNEIVQMDNLYADEMLIFDTMIKWAKYQCEKSTIPDTPSNIRRILGDIFYKIRFPIMKSKWILEIITTYPKLLTFDEQTNIFKFITKESQTCGKFNCNLRKCGYAFIRKVQTFDMYHGTLQRLACCSDELKITGKHSSELSIKFKFMRSTKKMIGFGTFRKVNGSRNLSCTFQSESLPANHSEISLSKSIFWPICWKIEYEEEYLTEPIQLQPNTWYTLRVKFNEEVPILHSKVSQDSSENVIIAEGQNNVIPYLLFG